MPETYTEFVLRELRDHEGYSGDGRGGVGELPVGDRSTARRPIYNATLRRIALEQENAVQTAVDAAAEASAAASLASTAMLDAQGASLFASNRAALLANTGTFPAGTVFSTRAEGYSFEVVSSGGHATTAGGVQLRVLPGKNGYDVGAFGAVGDGATDDSVAINAAFAAGGASFQPGMTYAFTTLAVPNGCKVRQNGATLKKTGSELIRWLTIGNNVTWDDLRLTLPGLGGAADQVVIGEGFSARSVVVRADAATGLGTLFTVRNAGLDVGLLDFKDVARPISLSNEGLTLGVGGKIGTLKVRNYIRAFSARYAYGWTIGSFDAKVRHAGASVSPGHNGILIEGSSDWTIQDAEVHDAAEHAFRIGGSVAGGASNNWTIGSLRCRNYGGCAFKINPTVGSEKSIGGSVNYLLGEGTFTAGPGGNSEFIRIAHARDISIGVAECYPIGAATVSCQIGLIVNDTVGLRIGTLRVIKPQGGMISFDDSIDGYAGPVTDVVIGTLEGDPGVGNNAISVAMATQLFGDFFILSGNVKGLNVNLFRASNISGGINGRQHIAMNVIGSTAPAIQDAPASLTVDISYQGRRVVGSAAQFSALATSAALGVAGGAFDPASVGSDKGAMMLDAATAAAGLNKFGAGMAFSRPGSSRRGAAVAVKQTGANDYDVGLSFLSGAGTTATDAVTEQMFLNHLGDLEFARNSRGPVIRSPDGTRYRIVAANGGALSTTPA